MILVFGDVKIAHTYTRVNLLKKLGEKIILIHNADNQDISKEKILYENITIIEQPKIYYSWLRYTVSCIFSLFLIIKYSPKVVFVLWASRLFQTIAFLFFSNKVITVAMGSDIMPNRDSANATKRFFTTLLLKSSRFIIVESYYAKKIIFKYFVKRKGIYILNFGVEDRFFHCSKKHDKLLETLNIKDKKIFFSIRALREVYQIHIIIKTYLQFIKDYSIKDTILLISSLNFHENYLQSIIKDIKGYEDSILLLPSINHRDIDRYIGISDVIISLSPSDGLSQSMIECLAAEKFMIYRDLKSYNNYLIHKKNSYLLESKNALVEAFKYSYYEDTNYTNSKKIYRRLNKKAQHCALLSIFKKIIKEKT